MLFPVINIIFMTTPRYFEKDIFLVSLRRRTVLAIQRKRKSIKAQIGQFLLVIS